VCKLAQRTGDIQVDTQRPARESALANFRARPGVNCRRNESTVVHDEYLRNAESYPLLPPGSQPARHRTDHRHWRPVPLDDNAYDSHAGSLGDPSMKDVELNDLYEISARANINRRCATAYLHDIRGSMHALFSAIELLGRSAKSGDGNQERIDKACELAKRAIGNHERTTLGAVQALALLDFDAAAVDVAVLAAEVVQFLRNHAAVKEVAVTTAAEGPVIVVAERAKLRALLMGLIMEAIDGSPSGADLRVAVARTGDDAVVSIGCAPGCAAISATQEFLPPANGRLDPLELTLVYARQYLRENGGRLEIDAGAQPRGELRLVYPAVA
jgi:hypothetical protein